MKATHGRIWEAASLDQGRPVLTGVQFDAEKGTLAATNTVILARVPCEVEEGDEPGLIPAAAVKEANGASLRVAGGWATLTLGDGERRWRLLEGTFPNVDALFPEDSISEHPLGLNPDLVAQLGHALGAGARSYPLVLHAVSPVRAIRVENRMGGEGLLMPVKLAG